MNNKRYEKESMLVQYSQRALYAERGNTKPAENGLGAAQPSGETNLVKL